MITENALLNIVQVWIEEALDAKARQFGGDREKNPFIGVKVIRTHQDAPEPMQARIDGIPTDGTSLFVTIDLTGDEQLPGWPLYCETGGDDTIERTRTLLREATFSISAYRHNGVDAARHLLSNIRSRQVQRDLFMPHNVAFKSVSGIAVINEIVLEQWERRAQFTLVLSYADTVTEFDEVIGLDSLPHACG